MRLVYIASPYSDQDPLVVHTRWVAVCRYAAECMRRGEVVFSPIAHTHPIAHHARPALPDGWEWWSGQDLPLLRMSSELRVLRLYGWEASLGVGSEIAEAERCGIPVTYADP